MTSTRRAERGGGLTRHVGMVLGLAALISSGAAVASPAAAAPAADRHMAPLLAAVRAHQAAGLSATNWRTKLAPTLHNLPAMAADRTVAAPLAGSVLARTLYLPATVTLTDDTTIVAHRLVFAGGPVSITTSGHSLHVYPIDALLISGAFTPQSNVVDIIANGANGSNGSGGAAGRAGIDGRDGASGSPGRDPWCDGENGENAQLGGTPGWAGGDGGGGGSGQPGGTITFDIPSGSTFWYNMQARGGSGGRGGNGGAGGAGGKGGNGGGGGDAELSASCYWGNGGWGGHGLFGADGGHGGYGGQGGNGGPGGYIRVTYPPGYDPSLILTDASAGAAGEGGFLGSGGAAGAGGLGGTGGRGSYFGSNGWPGSPGWDGQPGIDGSWGPSGSSAGPGTVEVIPRPA